MKRRRRHWYHCTDRDHGDRWIARRITPPVIGSSEPTTPRLCVSKTVAQCFAAVLFRPRPVHVYRTAITRSALPAHDVHDSCLTGERWIVPPVVMERIQVIPAVVVELIHDRKRQLIQRYRGLEMVDRAESYRDSLDLLEEVGVEVQPWERRFVNNVLELLEDRGYTSVALSHAGRGAA